MRVLYLSYNGLLEPLGQSQVLAYLEKLAPAHRITLVTFEKPADLAREADMAAMRARCEAAGIRWTVRRYRHRPRMLATMADLAIMLATAFREARRGRAELIHARSYIPCFVALAVGLLLRTPFIFDMRAFWPDEMVSAGRLGAGSPVFRLLKRAETLCLDHAAAVVSLTEAAAAHLAKTGRAGPGLQAVIPTCADTTRFRPRANRAGPPRVFGTTGTVIGGWFRLDWLFAFWAAALDAFPDIRFRVVTRDSPEAVRAAGVVWPDVLARLDIDSRSPAEMPSAVAEFDVAALFFLDDISERARCPTRMGEMLACGCPVVANATAGDVGAIIRRYRVGVVVHENSAPAMRRAAEELAGLLCDPELPGRCRAAAEDWFSLERGVEKYDRLYRQICDRKLKKSGDEIHNG